MNNGGVWQPAQQGFGDAVYFFACGGHDDETAYGMAASFGGNILLLTGGLVDTCNWPVAASRNESCQSVGLQTGRGAPSLYRYFGGPARQAGFFVGTKGNFRTPGSARHAYNLLYKYNHATQLSRVSTSACAAYFGDGERYIDSLFLGGNIDGGSSLAWQVAAFSLNELRYSQPVETGRAPSDQNYSAPTCSDGAERSPEP